MSSATQPAKTVLFIIDPQIDFHPGGSLGVPGADGDSARIADFINQNLDRIDEIHVSLDSHHRIHIAHGVFWKNPQGEHPPPFTLIRHDDVVRGDWTPADPGMLQHAKDYTHALEEKGRFVLCIWPEHCLIGTPGHAVVPVLNEALQAWVKANMKVVEYVHKGTNCQSEMYSALSAEVPVAGDATTELNHALLARLQQAQQVLICGEAKSHCVNYTMRDLLANWTGDPAQLVLLEDCASAVPGFEAAADAFVADMKAAGCTVTQAAAVQL